MKFFQKNIKLFVLFSLILVGASCTNPDSNPYHIHIKNEKIIYEIKTYIKNYSKNKKKIIVKMYLVSNTCQGVEIVLTADIPATSAILSCPPIGFDVIDNHIILIYGGVDFLYNLKYENFIDEFYIYFPIEELKDDWDKINNKSKEVYMFDPIVKGVRISGDSLYYFIPKNGNYFDPCMICQ